MSGRTEGGAKERGSVVTSSRLGERPDVLGVDADLVAGGLQLDQHLADLGRRQRADLDLDEAGPVALDVELLEDDPVGALAVDQEGVDMLDRDCGRGSIAACRTAPRYP